MNTSNSRSSFSVNGEGGQIKIEVLRYENSRPLTTSDANWLRVRTQLEAGGCVLEMETALTTRDLKCFLDELENLLSTFDGLAILSTDEETITLRVKVNKTGTAHILGELKELGTVKIRVEFEFYSDQSFLGQTLSELREIQSRWPIVESV
jgi:hypothetical protein